MCNNQEPAMEQQTLQGAQPPYSFFSAPAVFDPAHLLSSFGQSNLPTQTVNGINNQEPVMEQQTRQGAHFLFEPSRPIFDIAHPIFQTDLFNVHPLTENGFSEMPQLLNQSPGYEKAVNNIMKDVERLANDLFQPIGFDSSQKTSESSVPRNHEDYLYQYHRVAIPTQSIQSCTHPWIHLVSQPQMRAIPASICLERFQQLQRLMTNCWNQEVEMGNRVLLGPNSRPVLSSLPNQFVRFPAVNGNFAEQRSLEKSENLPHVRSLTSKSLNFFNMYPATVIGLKNNIARKSKSHFDDEPDIFEKRCGEYYEQFEFDYKMSREFAEKRFFEIFGCNYCLGRNQLIHRTNECRVLSSAQKCHQLATGKFCFKCIRPNHRTQDCKDFPQGCDKCRSPHHSKWTHMLIFELRERWGIRSQEEALQKCHTDGADWCDRYFPY